ncbi:hypothetical protein N0V90_005868 [Kalmusia sp. IMI 367209]|nr:hypothetical protein N0V90_005868 [Kalmusia sp. IMI 367209]
MSLAGPDFQSHGPVQGNNVLQGVTTGNNTIINFLKSGKGGAPQGEREACLRTLGFLEIDSREQDISAAVETTCDWLFDTLEFKKWQDRTDLVTNNGVLCIKGKPGAGKSTLMKHTLEHCKNAFPDNLIIAYFFSARGSTLEKSQLGMLRSIAYQLVKKDFALFDQFLDTFRDRNITSQGRQWEWQPRQLKAFIRSVIKRYRSKPLLLLVDALDECNEAEMQHVVEILESLSIDANRSGTTLRICLSRRHHPPLRIAKSLELIVEDNQDHREDIATYIRAKLARPGRDTGIEAEIEKKANGIFMWVVLVVRLLNKASLKVKGKKKAMQDALEEIPGELEEVFRIMFNKDDKDMAETVLMLQWVLFAQRPLTPEELYAAVETGDTDLWSPSSDNDHDSIQQSIENLSKGLIEIRGRNRATVQFIHLSVNDFLLRNKRLQTLHQALEPDPVTASHHRLWACCWSLIEHVSNISTKKTYKELRREYPFLGYAASHILDHAKKALDEGAAGQAGVPIKEWLRHSSSWFKWWKSFLIATDASDEEIYPVRNMDAGLLYMLSLRGYGSLVKCLLAEDGEEGEEGEEGADVNAQGGLYGNALQVAILQREQQIVELLLKAGADVNAQGGFYGNALQAASYKGEQQIVELLLKAGADVNAQGGEYGNALQAASYEGEQQIVELLLKAGADVNAQGGFYGNALQAASFDGEQQIVELLLKAGAEVNAQGGEYGNALQAASFNGEQIVELLLKAGADVNAQGGEYGNVLQAASYQREQQIVELLLKAGADVNAQGGEYGNALQAASFNGEQQIVELLLKAGADVNAQGGPYGNALQAASYKGEQQIVELLLKAGADVNAQGGEYGNALQAASYKGKQQIVKLLLKAGAEVDAQGGEYGNAIRAALYRGHYDIENMLRKAGATAIAQHTEFEVVNAGVADTEGVSVEKRHEGALPEAAPAMGSPSTETPSPGICEALSIFLTGDRMATSAEVDEHIDHASREDGRPALAMNL